MIIRIISWIIGISLAIGFIWFAAQVVFLGVSSFFSNRKNNKKNNKKGNY